MLIRKDKIRDSIENCLQRLLKGEGTGDEMRQRIDLLKIYFEQYGDSAAGLEKSAPIVSITEFPRNGLVGIDKVCKFVGRSRTWINEQRKKGQFPEPNYKDGNENRWNAEDIWLWRDCRGQIAK